MMTIAAAKPPKRILSMFGLFVLTAIVLACGGSNESNGSSVLIEQGNRIYAESFQVCHGDASTGRGGVLNAPIHGPTGHTWHHADGQIKEIILGTFDFPGKTMPAFADVLGDEDIDALLAYFKSNWDREQLEWQAEVSQNWIELKRVEGSANSR